MATWPPVGISGRLKSIPGTSYKTNAAECLSRRIHVASLAVVRRGGGVGGVAYARRKPADPQH